MKIGVALILAACCALASTNNCPNGTANSSVDNGTTSNTALIVGAGPGNDFGTLGAGGCTNVDLAFTNFSGTFSGNGTGSNALTISGTYFASTPAGTGYDPLTTPTSVLISSVRGAANITGSGDNTDANDGVNNFVSNSNGSSHVVNDNLAFVVTAGQLGTSLALKSINVTVNFPAVTGATGSITFNICLGGNATGVVTGAGSCTGGGTFQQQVVTLTTGTTQTATINLTTPQVRIDFSTVVNLSGGSASANAGFDSIGFSFTEQTPEPSTFVLVGIAFSGLGVLGYHRRKSRT